MDLPQLERRDLAALRAHEVRDGLPVPIFRQPRITRRDPLEGLVVLVGYVVVVVIAEHDCLHDFSVEIWARKVKMEC